MSDLADLAEQYQRNFLAWSHAGPPRVAASIEVCQRHAADWLALHVLARNAAGYVELMSKHWRPDMVVLAGENAVAAVAACRRLAAHLKEPATRGENRG